MNNKLILKKENGETTILEYTEELENKLNEEFSELSENKGGNAGHLCYDCTKGYAGECPKITDRRKKSISKYDYVTDGYQIINENNEVEKFVVAKCKEYVYAGKTPPKSSAERKRLMDSLSMHYFNASSPEEARRIQRELMSYPQPKEGEEDQYKNRRLQGGRGKNALRIQRDLDEKERARQKLAHEMEEKYGLHSSNEEEIKHGK